MTMKKKHRNIVVEGQKYGWTISYSATYVSIWQDKKVILETTVSNHLKAVTPKIVEAIIRKDILGEVPAYVLLRNTEHQNVFWTPYDASNDYKAEGLDILFTSSDNNDMVAEWKKYNPDPYMDNLLGLMKTFGGKL